MPPLPLRQLKATPGRLRAQTRGDKPRGFLTRVVQTIDKGHRWYLERDEPDAAGRWDDDHRRSTLRYVYERDGGRCGLCTAEMKIKGAQIEHVVPKVFVLFDVGKGGRAEPGTQYKSRLHKIDNLQAAHTYCNKRKGNTPEVDKWRHPAMPTLTVADIEDGRALVLPPRVEGSISALTPGNRQHHRHSLSVLTAAARCLVSPIRA